MNIPYVFKKCTKCGEWLVASSVNFHKNKSSKYRLNSKCKKCRIERSRQRYQDNKEAEAERKRRYRKENKEAIAEQKRQYYQANKEVIKERTKEYKEENKEAIAERGKKYYKRNKERIAERQRQYYQSPQGQVVAFNHCNRRRAKEQAQGRGITKEQWLECMSFFNWQCAYSGEPLTKDNRSLDHIEPINKGGANEVYNLVPMYQPYNSSKHDKDMLEWYTEQPYFSQERLNKIYEWQEYAYNKWAIDTEAQ